MRTRPEIHAVVWLAEQGLFRGLKLEQCAGMTCVVEHHECPRCNGTGNVGFGPHGGICFRCNGTGDRRVTKVTILQYARRMRQRAQAQRR